MANSILTPTMITRESLRVLHSKMSFLGNVSRQYDDRFAQSGAKIGTSLNIRMPSRYTVRTNATLAANDHVERSTPLAVASQYGVDVSFTSVELTMSLDDFSKRIISPAMAQLAATLESTAVTAAYKLVPNYAGTTSTTLTYATFQSNSRFMTERLSPPDNRTGLLNPQSRVDFSVDVKGLFQDASAIAEQYKEGIVGRTGGFTMYESTLVPSHTIGSLAGSPLTTGAALGTSTTSNAWVSTTDMVIDTATSATTIAAGDVLTFGTLAAGLVDVHPESKVSYGVLKKFVCQTAVTCSTLANSYTVTVRPGVIYGVGNAYQNCSLTKADTDNMTVTNWGAASTAVGQNLFFHEDAFVFATADLEDVSKYGAWGARQTQDGISMRIARNYDITNDRFPCRIDVLWGFAGLYPDLASRAIHAIV